VRRHQRPPLFPYTTLFRSATPEKVGATLRAHFQNAYRPKTGNARGRPARVSTRKVTVPSAVAEVLDAATWDAMRQAGAVTDSERSEEHTSELQSRENLVCR